MPRRLLIVADTLAGGLGGATVAHHDWFAGRGWEVRVAAPADEPGGYAVGDHVPVVLPATARDLRGQWRAGSDIRALARSFRPDIVHCHGARCFAATRLRVGGLSRDPLKVPWVTLHGSPDMTFDPRGYGKVRRLGVATIPRLAGRAVSVAPDVPDGWLFAPSASGRLRQWSRLGAPTADVPTFLWLGRLGEPKQPEVFVRAMAALRDRVPSAVGVMAGIGPLGESVAALVASLGAPVSLLGQVADPLPLLESCWAAVVFSAGEGITFAVEEAMWVGRAVVSSDLPGNAWLLDDPSVLASTVSAAVEVFERLCSYPVAAELGARNAERVRSVLSPDDPWPTVEGWYESALGGRSA